MEEPGLISMEPLENKGVRMSFAPGPMLQMFVAEMKDCLQKNQGINYVEFSMIDNESGEEWLLTLQRAEGLTPGFKAHQAEVKADRLCREVENLLRSATPHPVDNPTMHAAWKRATRIMADLGHPVPVNYIKQAGDPA